MRKHKNKEVKKAYKRMNIILKEANHKKLLEQAQKSLTNNTRLPEHNCQIFTETRDIIKNTLKKQSSNNNDHFKQTTEEKIEQQPNKNTDITPEISSIENKGKILVAKIILKSTTTTIKIEQAIKLYKKQTKEYIKKLELTNPRKYNYLTRKHIQIIELFQNE